MMATKEQERKALEQIRKIVADLGEDSYIATAFQGCFEDAEENIENDFAVSNYQRWQSAEHRANGLAEDVEKLQEQVKDLEETRKFLIDEKLSLKERLENTEKKVLSIGLYKRLWLCVESQEGRAQEQMLSIASTLADLEDAPSDVGVAHSLKCLAKAKRDRLEAGALLEALEKYEEKE